MPRRSWRHALAAGLALVLALAPAAPAATAPDVIARALKGSPVYVDPAFAAAVPEDQRRSLVRALRAEPRSVYVALVPIIAGDEYGGDARQFLSVLHDRLGRDGVYVTIHDGYLQTRQYGSEDAAVDEATSVIIGEGPRDETPAARVKRFLAALADPALHERYLRARGTTDTPAPPAGDEDGGGGSGTLLVVLAGLALAAAVAVVLLRRRRGAGYAPEPLPVLPRRVFENARAAAEEDLRDQAREAVFAFAAALDPVAPPTEPAAADYALALDAHSAASRTLDRARGVPDLVGVLALIDRGYTALAAAQAQAAGRPRPPVAPLCLFNPLHGHADAEVAWHDGLRVPVCMDCARALRRGDAPDALRDGSQPYLEGDSVWARTGYGVFGDDLVARVAQGRSA